VKLFEFERLEEGIAEVRNVKDIVVLINDHMFNQARARQIPLDVVNGVIKRIPDVRNKFKPLDENMKFVIWSKGLNAGIGLRKRLDKDGYQRVEVVTAINKLYDSSELVFYVG